MSIDHNGGHLPNTTHKFEVKWLEEEQFEEAVHRGSPDAGRKRLYHRGWSRNTEAIHGEKQPHRPEPV